MFDVDDVKTSFSMVLEEYLNFFVCFALYSFLAPTSAFSARGDRRIKRPTYDIDRHA
jgi:hypothetical protein